MPEDMLLLPREAAEYLRISPRSLRRLVAQGALPVTKIGGANRHRKSDRDSYIRKQTRPSAPRFERRGAGVEIGGTTWWR